MVLLSKSVFLKCVERIHLQMDTLLANVYLSNPLPTVVRWGRRHPYECSLPAWSLPGSWVGSSIWLEDWDSRNGGAFPCSAILLSSWKFSLWEYILMFFNERKLIWPTDNIGNYYVPVTALVAEGIKTWRKTQHQLGNSKKNIAFETTEQFWICNYMLGLLKLTDFW